MVLLLILFFNILALIDRQIDAHCPINAVLNSTNLPSIHYEYHVNTVNQEFVVIFKNFYLKSERARFIHAAIKHANFNSNSYQISNESHLINNEFIPSDFDVIQFNTINFENAINGLKSHPLIKHINPQRKLTRILKESENEESEYEYIELEIDDSEEESEIHSKGRSLNRAIPIQISDRVHAPALWNLGHTGKGVNVAVFDTGLEESHPHFRNVIERIDWTHDKNANDPIGHGTFVAGVIASTRECLGLAPDVNLYIFKVFTKNHASYTSWFLDAFNHAIRRKIDILNLSIGGPDFMDRAFVEKVWQMSSNNICMVSAIGNDGPLYGTLNNPADQMDVIGVGGINYEDKLARFSSRGMTTWELPNGYGRVKPDLVTYGAGVRGSNKKKGCKALSGTSVASPVVAGAVALLLSAFKESDVEVNPARLKQVLMESAKRVKNANMFEQGAGKLDLLAAYELLLTTKPHVSLSPAYVDMSECPYMWPYCVQPMFYSQLPVVFNVTVINSGAVEARFAAKPRWRPDSEWGGECVSFNVEHSSRLWPWSGFMALRVRVNEACERWSGFVTGFLEFRLDAGELLESVKMPVKLRIIERPPRAQRILWDQFHNLRYPPGYFPRDDLKVKSDPLDWHADHIHTNFKDMFEHLVGAGYYVDVLGESFNCFNASNYGTLLIMDSEEEFSASEIAKLEKDVKELGLSLVVFADWYNASVIKWAKFFDDNSQQWWLPNTGGANLPALNELLEPFGIAFGDIVFEGEFQIGDHIAFYSSGTSIIKFPEGESSYLIARNLNDEGHEILSEKKRSVKNVPILGLLQVNFGGRVVVFGDSNCVDSTHLHKECFWLIQAILQYTSHNVLPNLLKENSKVNGELPKNLPKRLKESSFVNFTKINEQFDSCQVLIYEKPFFGNDEFGSVEENMIISGDLHRKIQEKLKKQEDEIKNVKGSLEKLSKDLRELEEIRNKNALNAIFDSHLPVLTIVAILVVITFFVHRTFRYCTRSRIQRIYRTQASRNTFQPSSKRSLFLFQSKRNII